MLDYTHLYNDIATFRLTPHAQGKYSINSHSKLEVMIPLS